MTVTIYLAGPVSAAEDPVRWRENIINGHAGSPRVDFKNPLTKYNAPADNLDIVAGASDPEDDGTVGVDEIVEADKQMIQESDAVLVGYSDVEQIGTPMEVIFAYERDMPVAVWLRSSVDDSLSPWYRHHACSISRSAHISIAKLKQEVRLRD